MYMYMISLLFLSLSTFFLFLSSPPLPPSQGHAVIYFIPVNEVTADLLEPDYGALAKLCE